MKDVNFSKLLCLTEVDIDKSKMVAKRELKQRTNLQMHRRNMTVEENHHEVRYEKS